MLQEARSLKKNIEQLDRAREAKEVLRRLGKIDIEMVYKDYGLHTVYNYGTRAGSLDELYFVMSF